MKSMEFSSVIQRYMELVDELERTFINAKARLKALREVSEWEQEVERKWAASQRDDDGEPVEDDV